MKHSKLTALIFIALVLGVLFGHFAPDFAVKMKPLAVIFLRMVKMIIAPLLFATLVVGIAGHGSANRLGKIGLKTIVYFEIATTVGAVNMCIGHHAGVVARHKHHCPSKSFHRFSELYFHTSLPVARTAAAVTRALIVQSSAPLSTALTRAAVTPRPVRVSEIRFLIWRPNWAATELSRDISSSWFSEGSILTIMSPDSSVPATALCISMSKITVY